MILALSTTQALTEKAVLVMVVAAAVYLILGCFWLVLDIRRRLSGAPASAVAQQPAAAEPALSGDVTPEIVAVVAAAVHTLIREPHRILSITQAGDRAGQQSQEILAWSMEGRRQIFQSHKVR